MILIKNNIEIYLSKLDTDRFGFQVAKISDSIENPSMILQELKKISTKLVIARINLKKMKLINQLEKIGFTYKDAQITFSFDLNKELPINTHKDFLLTKYNSRHLSQIIEMTKYSFKNYGHYFADEKLDKDKCLEIYVDWIKRCCENTDVADNIIIAEKNDLAIGYLALKTYDNKNERYVAGVIGAVDPEYRKMGVFQAINIESILLAKELGANRIENNVLITNYPVMKSYTSLSYKIINSEITMHYWYE